MPAESILVLLERIRSIAQLGLHYSKDEYDRQRYEQLLTLASGEYEAVAAMPSTAIRELFRNELGHITTKVGVNAAIFSSDKKLLLTRRADDGLWELPGGWVDAGETPEEAVAREMLEEIVTEVTVKSLVGVFSRRPGDFMQPHSSCHLVYHCAAPNLLPQFSYEVSAAQFVDSTEGIQWHRDHAAMAAAALEYQQALLLKS